MSSKPVEEKIEQHLPEIIFPLLDHEKQIFIDIFEKDGLVILAKGLNYSSIVCNLLWVYRDPGNLVLVINSNEYEEKYFTSRLELKQLPITSSDRERVYLEGGVHFVSTRVLVVDLLRGRVPVANLTGVLVLRAHTVLESCQEAFALRLYRQANKTGFIKAFSASPVSFTFGYHQVEKVMRALFVTELYLWPRFHGTVIRSLSGSDARVEELRVPLSSAVAHMQACLLEIINHTVAQLNKGHSHLQLQEVTAENCITKQFHKMLASQLEPTWHRLTEGARQLLQDLKLLRTLILELVHGDAVSFLSAALVYQRPEYAVTSSGWVLHAAADQLYRLARGRVFNNNKFDPELCPKWKCLTDLLLREIPDLVRKLPGSELRNTKILILCQDKRTCYRLSLVLTMGPLRYLLYMALNKGLKVTALADKFDNIEVEACGQRDDQEEDEEDSKAESSYVLTVTQAGRGEPIDNDSMFEPISQIENLDLTQLETGSPIVTIQTFKHNGDPFSLQRTLETLRPHYVIMYHSDVGAVRQLEQHCRSTECPPALYVVMYDGCVEEQAYLTALRREKQAFTHLIQTKAEMVVPSYQDGKTDEYFCLDHEQDDCSADTRKAGGQSSWERAAPAVVVDVREFRSELPALLHKRRLQVIPLTITVGDYVLTPEVCVERKAPADLASSLTGGRLYAQASELVRHYARPVLLLELGTYHSMGHGVWGADVIQRLQLLTLHFPRLKLVWSPSPYATAELFAELKQGRKNPDVASLTASATAAVEEPQQTHNESACQFLRRVPAVTRHSLHSLMHRTRSLRTLAASSQEELATALENPRQAGDLYAVLHMRLAPDPREKARSKPFRKYCSRS